MDDCSIENELYPKERHSIAMDAVFNLGTFSFPEYTRKVNHIVSLLDSWTIWDRICKDDIAVMDIIKQYNVTQISEFLNLAIESNATILIATLLDYKQKNFSEYDKYASLNDFVLEEL